MCEAEYVEFSELVRTVHYAIKDATKVEYLTIVQEENSVHFHLWFFPWTQDVIEQHGQPSLTKIREIMTNYRNREISEVEWKELEKSIAKIKMFLA